MTIIDPVARSGLGALEGPAPQTATAGASGDFAAVLGQLASEAATTLRASEQVSVAGVQGKASVQQVVETVMAAEQTLQSAIAIRDKVVSAYLEISRMSI